MPERIRPDRVAESFKEVIAIEIGKLKDPRVGFVTVTAVGVTPDLRKARVFYSVMGDESSRRGTQAGLNSARKHLRASLGRKIRLKYLPDIEFVQDETLESGVRVEAILKDLEAKSD
jgi:ribosome-binding factor A